MGCAEAILLTSQSHLWTSKHFAGEKREREINALHGAHSAPVRPKINGVIYLLGARPVLSRALRSPLVPGSTSNTNPKPCHHPPVHPKQPQEPPAVAFGHRHHAQRWKQTREPGKFHGCQHFQAPARAQQKSLGGENILGTAKLIREGRGDWNGDGIAPNRARNSSGKTKHLEA